ncbi:MAG: hypothetical protein FWE52_04415 [Alphaproteobacteria bacterium]|nr:hypothetical protein [Alphaproteobacteria bacterium]
MRKIITSVIVFSALASPVFANIGDESLGSGGFTPVTAFILDTEDPMFFEAARDFVSRSAIYVGNERFQAQQRFSYGINGNMAISADVNYQASYHTDNTGFSGIGLTGWYRAQDTATKIDIFAGLNFTGAASVPNYSDTVYAAGVRVGRQWNWVTLATVAQTSWIFDEVNGMAFIDIIPEAYFRIGWDWSLGANAILRKSTNPNFDQQWLGAKVAKRYGRTMYVGSFDYEFETEEWRIGARLNLLF